MTRFLSLSSTMSSLIMIHLAWNSPSDATWHYDFYDSSASRFHRRIVLFSVFLLSLRYFHDVLRVKFTDRVSISTSTCSGCPSLFFLVIALYNVLHIQWLAQLWSNSWNNQIYKETRWPSPFFLFDTQVASYRFYLNNVGDLTIAFLLLCASIVEESGISNRKFEESKKLF